MALVILGDGDDITAANIEANWEACRTVINAQTTRTIRRKVFGPQHLPSLLRDRYSGTANPRDRKYQASETLVDHAFTGVAAADIRTDWQEMLKLDGVASAGYVFNKCLTLVWACGIVRRFSADDTDAQAHFALTIDTSTAAEECVDATSIGFVVSDGVVYGNAALDEHKYEGVPFGIWALLDKTNTIGSFTVDAFRLRCAYDATTWYIGDMEIGFFSVAQASAG